MVWPLIPFSYNTINYNLPGPAPSPPSRVNWLGTDDQGRDVTGSADLRLSHLGAVRADLTLLSSVVGVAAGAVQGYFGGLVDLGFQRFIEIWSGLPVLYLLIIMASFVEPNFWWLLGLMLLFSWTGLVDVVRAEFLRARNFDYVRAARALGVPDSDHHFAPRPAERDGSDDHVSAVHPERLDHDTDFARFPRLRAAAGFGLARRTCWPRARPICRRRGSG